jgi:MoxR-like ATPase
MLWNEIKTSLYDLDYIASEDLAMSIHIAINLERPLLLEGEAGIGKTALGIALSKLYKTNLIRLQCYEGLDSASTIYEWNYQKQLLSIRLNENDSDNKVKIDDYIFSKEFLLERPLLKALTQKKAPVLLIDEIDRADEEFEAYLLEILSEYQVSIPEYGTIQAVTKPIVIITSNNTRDLSDALRRRCIYNYMYYPEKELELEILQKKLPNIDFQLSEQIVNFVQNLRLQDLDKKPGIAETLDWAAAISGLGLKDLSENYKILQSTLVCLLKTEADKAVISPETLQKLAKI